MIKNIIVRIRTSLKVISLIAIATLIIGCIFLYVYRPIYSVTINGEFVGYTENKSKLQNQINQYIQGDGNNVAFVQVDNLPEYNMCLLKKGNVTNDEEIFDTVKQQGTTYYEYYAITEDEKEKSYVATYEDAKTVTDELKDKKSNNISKIGIVKKYDTTLPEFDTTAKIVAALYVKPPAPKPVAVKTAVYTSSYKPTYSKTENSPSNKIAIGITLAKPVNGVITSRYGYRRSGFHTGLDIAQPIGTKIKAAAAGTVEYAGWSSSGYGIYVIISHGNGIETLYAHCKEVYVKVGQQVSQGQVIAAIGMTGNTTGPHVHFEVRINGQCQNPQNYIYQRSLNK